MKIREKLKTENPRKKEKLKIREILDFCKRESIVRMMY